MDALNLCSRLSLVHNVNIISRHHTSSYLNNWSVSQTLADHFAVLDFPLLLYKMMS